VWLEIAEWCVSLCDDSSVGGNSRSCVGDNSRSSVVVSLEIAEWCVCRCAAFL
jgi:hypothetical protein